MANESLDLGQLRTFVAIADHGGFGRAATALHLSQPAVSQHVRLLERRLRRALVEKDGRRTRFTASGERLLIEARQILAAHDEALARLDVANLPPVTIGSTETAAEQVLPRLLTTLRDAYPGRGVQFHIDRSTQMTEAVLKGSIDLAVLLGFAGDTHGQLVGTLPLRWYSAPARPVPQREQSLSLVAYREPCGMRQRALRRLAEAGHRVEVTAESTSLEGVIAAARAGLGVAVLPSAGVTPHGLVQRHDLPELGVIGVHLATRRDLDTELAATAMNALEGFFDAAPASRLAG